MSDKKTVLSKAQLAEKIGELGQRITSDYADKQLVMVGILNGAFIFLADLCRAVDLPIEIDFIRAASYGSHTVSSGTVNLSKDIELAVAGKHVLLVEDIVDTGRTMRSLKNHVLAKNPASLKICALIDKKERREEDVEVDYTGFEVEKGFLVGYGLDFAGLHRNHPEIYHLFSPEK